MQYSTLHFALVNHKLVSYLSTVMQHFSKKEMLKKNKTISQQLQYNRKALHLEKSLAFECILVSCREVLIEIYLFA